MIARLLLDRPGAQHRADDALALDHQAADVELGLGAAEQADDHEAAVEREAGEVRLEIGAADVVEDHVGAAPFGELEHALRAKSSVLYRIA